MEFRVPGTRGAGRSCTGLLPTAFFLGNAQAIFPYTSPALFSMTAGFVGIWLFSITDRSEQAARERAAYPAQEIRSETGLGAAGASGH